MELSHPRQCSIAHHKLTNSLAASADIESGIHILSLPAAWKHKYGIMPTYTRIKWAATEFILA